jgi:hypothetical protein
MNNRGKVTEPVLDETTHEEQIHRLVRARKVSNRVDGETNCSRDRQQRQKQQRRQLIP